MSNPIVKFCRGTYKECKEKNYIISDGMILVVTILPWYKSWFGLRPTRMKIGDGKTKFYKLKFI